jgi:ABC-2 type transport system ATP-binding protein
MILLNDPEVLLMDEPTASLDPDIADKTLSIIEQLRKEQNLSILYTSHQMDEVTRICDEVIFLDHGKIVAQDTPVGLTKRIKNAKIKLIFTDNKETLEKFLQKNDFKFEFLTKNNVLIESEEKQIPKLIFEISKLNINVTDIEINKPTLEDVFLQIARGEKDVT